MGSKSSRHNSVSNVFLRVNPQKQNQKEQKKDAKRKKKLKISQDKHKKKYKKTKNHGKHSATLKEANKRPINQTEYENSVCLKLREQVENDLSTFVLNQVSLSVQFFSNYERKRTSIYNDNLEKERDLNQHLEEHSIMLQNAVDKSIEERIQFRPK